MAKAIHEALLDGPYSVDDFLAWEREQPERYEYIGGVIRMMVGGTNDHNVIALNIAAELRQRLRGGPCRAFSQAAKITTGTASLYPDVVVTCTAFDPKSNVVPAPVIVFEVLSGSTGSYDMGEKWLAYQTIDSLRQYVLVSQNRVRIDVYDRAGDGWSYRTLTETDARLKISVGDVELTMAEIYEGSVPDPAKAS